MFLLGAGPAVTLADAIAADRRGDHVGAADEFKVKQIARRDQVVERQMREIIFVMLEERQIDLGLRVHMHSPSRQALDNAMEVPCEAALHLEVVFDHKSSCGASASISELLIVTSAFHRDRCRYESGRRRGSPGDLRPGIDGFPAWAGNPSMHQETSSGVSRQAR
jgi:hypothetical protein